MTTQAADCHLHVFDPVRFPYAKDAAYMPPPHEAGRIDELLPVMDAHGISHALAVGPTAGYGPDNSCLLDAIARSNGRLKGIGVVLPGATEKALAALKAGGVVGNRLDFSARGAALFTSAEGRRLIDQCRAIGWIVQVQYEGDQLVEAVDVLRKAKVPLIFDHCGRPLPERGLQQPGFQALLALGREGHAVKLSGPFRFSRLGAPHADVEPYVQAILEAFTPDRCVWGSDWPFLRMASRIDYGPVRAHLDRWVPDAAARRKILWDTPKRLFGFG